jgi:hypothetical protein
VDFTSATIGAGESAPAFRVRFTVRVPRAAILAGGRSRACSVEDDEGGSALPVPPAKRPRMVATAAGAAAAALAPVRAGGEVADADAEDEVTLVWVSDVVIQLTTADLGTGTGGATSGKRGKTSRKGGSAGGGRHAPARVGHKRSRDGAMRTLSSHSAGSSETSSRSGDSMEHDSYSDGEASA